MAVVLIFGLLACGEKGGKLDPNKTYSDVTNTCDLMKNPEGKNFVKDGIGYAQLNRITDGDTASFIVDGQYLVVRFFGIDTPESTGQVDKWGVSASLFVKGLISKDSQFILESSTGGRAEKDSYGERYLGYVWYRNSDNEEWTNLNLLIVENGFSACTVPNSPEYVYYPYFKNAESFAKKGELHIWSTDIDPNYSDEAIEVTFKDLIDDVELYWNDESQSGAKITFEAIIIGCEISDTGTYMFTGAQLIDGKLYTYNIYGAYASSSVTSYLKIGNKYNITGVLANYQGDFQISGLVHVLGESGEGYTHEVEKESYIMFNGSLPYDVSYNKNLKTDATVTNASLEGTKLTLTVTAQTITKKGIDEEVVTYTVTATVDENFNAESLLNKTMTGNVYKVGSEYQALNFYDLSFK